MRWLWCLLIVYRVVQAERGQGHETRSRAGPGATHIGPGSAGETPGESAVLDAGDAAELVREAAEERAPPRMSALQTRSQEEEENPAQFVNAVEDFENTPSKTTPRKENRASIPPILKWHGEYFTDKHFKDLKKVLKIEGQFAGPFSVAFQLRQDYFTKWTRIIDFGSPLTAPALNNIQVMTTGEKGGMRFSIGGNSNRNKPNANLYLDAKKAIDIGVMHNYLCTVSQDGEMFMYRDGKIIAGPYSGQAPVAVERSNYFVGKSLWDDTTRTFQGVIGNLQIWSKTVLWQDPTWDTNLDYEFPPDEIGGDLGFFSGWAHYIYNAGRGFWEILMATIAVLAIAIIWCCCMLRVKKNDDETTHPKKKKKEKTDVDYAYG